MKKKVRIGLIGAGRIGRLHGENLAQAIPDADLCAIADPCLNDEMKSWASSLNITQDARNCSTTFLTPMLP